MEFFIMINGEMKGPFPLDKLLEQGITRDTRVCLSGSQEWELAENVKELDSLWKPKKEKKAIPEPKQEGTYLLPSNETINTESLSTPSSSETDSSRGKPEESPKPREFKLNYGVIFGFVATIVAAISLMIYYKKDANILSGKDLPIIIPVDSVGAIMLPPKIENPQGMYDKLIHEARGYYEKDSLSLALKTFATAQIIRKNYKLSISKEAKDIYKIAIDKGDQVYEGQLKELMPLALNHYEIAQAIDSTLVVADKIKKCN